MTLNRRIIEKLLTHLGLFLAVALAGGCASTGDKSTRSTEEAATGTTVSKTKDLAERSEVRWKLLIDKDAAAAWEYLTPGYRQSVSKDKYAQLMNNRPVVWVAAEYSSQECESEEACDVLVKVTYRLPLNVGGARPAQTETAQVLRERWLKIGRNWYHLPRDLL